jgi:alkylhydroperoxidase family enzyme
MTWITHIPYAEAGGTLRELYDRIKGPNDNVDNIMLAHSLRPHTMQGHMTLYKYVLHHPRNTLPKHYLETIGVYVSLLNRCEYCVEHHYKFAVCCPTATRKQHSRGRNWRGCITRRS